MELSKLSQWLSPLAVVAGYFLSTIGIVQKVFSEKASAIARNASEMRQKSVKNASKRVLFYIGKRGTFQNASQMHQKCAEHLWARTPFGRYRRKWDAEISGKQRPHKFKKNARDTGRMSLGHPAGQTGVYRPVSQGFPIEKRTEKAIFAGTPAGCPRDTRPSRGFSDILCDFFSCAFSAH